MPPDSPPNGSGDPAAAFKKPAPHDRPSLAAQMAQADAEQINAANAEMERLAAERAMAERAVVEEALDANPFLRALPAVYGPALVEAVAQGVQIGLQRAAQAEQQAQQHAAAQAPPGKPILLAQTGNVHIAAQAAMTGMPPPGPPQ